MSEKVTAFIACLIVMIIGLVWIIMDMAEDNQGLKVQVGKQKENIEILQRCQEYYTIRDSISVASIQAVQYDRDQYKALVESKVKEINELKKDKKKVVEHYTDVTKTDTFVITRLDTVIRDKDTCIVHEDKYVRFFACPDTISIQMNDTIRQVISKVYKHKILWWRWGDGGYKQEMWSTNPHSRIHYNEFVNIE